MTWTKGCCQDEKVQMGLVHSRLWSQQCMEVGRLWVVSQKEEPNIPRLLGMGLWGEGIQRKGDN